MVWHDWQRFFFKTTDAFRVDRLLQVLIQLVTITTLLVIVLSEKLVKTFCCSTFVHCVPLSVLLCIHLCVLGVPPLCNSIEINGKTHGKIIYDEKYISTYLSAHSVDGLQVNNAKWRCAANKQCIFNCWYHLMRAHGSCSLSFAIHCSHLYNCVMLIALIITPSFAHCSSWSEVLCSVCFISSRGNMSSSPTAKASVQPSSPFSLVK